MWPGELNDLVVKLREKIQLHGDIYRSNESATRYSLIDPVLTALGWDLADTSQVLPEYPLGGSETGRGRRRVADYAMLQEDGSPQFFVEAKSLDTPVNSDSDAVEQAINYTIRSVCEFVVVTNGDTWEAYAPRASGELRERRTTAFKVSDGDLRNTVAGMLWLWRWRWESNIPVDLPGVEAPNDNSTHGTSLPNVEISDSPTPPVTTRTPRRSISEVVVEPKGSPLSKLTDVTGKPPPQFMSFSDGSRRPLGYWYRLQAAAVEWLVDSGRLKDSDCPLTNSRRTHLVHTAPIRRDGKRFTQPAQIGQLWIDAHASASNHVSRANDILNAAGVDPATVFVS